jgi:hypothetical protein
MRFLGLLKSSTLWTTSIDSRNRNFFRDECHLRAEICKVAAMPPHAIWRAREAERADKRAASVKRLTDSMPPPG